MAFLERLIIVVATKPSYISPILHRRERLIEKLYEQLECAKAKIDGREHFVHQMRNLKAPTVKTV